MNTPRVPKLDPGHWITLFAILAQAVIIVAVLNWRMGAVERRLDTIDDRLWEHMSSSHTKTASLCPADATMWTLARVP